MIYFYRIKAELDDYPMGFIQVRNKDKIFLEYNYSEATVFTSIEETVSYVKRLWRAGYVPILVTNKTEHNNLKINKDTISLFKILNLIKSK